jgi:hypothetical protein
MYEKFDNKIVVMSSARLDTGLKLLFIDVLKLCQTQRKIIEIDRI